VFENKMMVLPHKPTFSKYWDAFGLLKPGRLALLSTISTIIFILASLMTHAQHISEMQLLTDRSSQIISSHKAISAVVLRARLPVFENLTVQSGDRLIQLQVDEHYSSNDGFYHSTPIVFESPVFEIGLQGLIADKGASLFLISMPETDTPEDKPDLRNNCDKPMMIVQDEWRAGLPNPDYERIFNQVGNIIIHHSATDNDITNHTDLVRSIYVYHTQINGWSDIGYNYLIAPDGSIYSGRDPGDKLYDDEVLGAHFCASNTGTLGICLLGNFTETKPTDKALQALNKLISWKSAKDSLWPLGEYPHPLNQQLAVVAGHRHGCATLCPGDSVLSHLHTIRFNSNATLQNCGMFLQIDDMRNQVADLLVVPNPVTASSFDVYISEKEVSDVMLYSMQGDQVDFNYVRKANRFSINAQMKPGFYLLVVVTKSGVFSTKLVKTS